MTECSILAIEIWTKAPNGYLIPTFMKNTMTIMGIEVDLNALRAKKQFSFEETKEVANEACERFYNKTFPEVRVEMTDRWTLVTKTHVKIYRIVYVVENVNELFKISVQQKDQTQYLRNSCPASLTYNKTNIPLHRADLKDDTISTPPPTPTKEKPSILETVSNAGRTLLKLQEVGKITRQLIGGGGNDDVEENGLPSS